MAINQTAAKFLLSQMREGIRLDRTLMIGRQSMLVSPRDLYRLGNQSGTAGSGGTDQKSFERSVACDPYYAEPWLKELGAGEVRSLDGSDYEGAEWVHDLNQPIPEDWKSSQDLVLDFGTLEHVFDVPQALKNYIQLLSPNGDLIIGTVANNFCGHGFYQFSPEFFYRALTRENGMEIRRVALVEDDVVWGGALGYRTPIFINGPFYDVRDPDEDKARVELIHHRQVMVFVHARKLDSLEPFKTTPQQSDYQAVWNNDSSASATHDIQQQGKLKSWLEKRYSLSGFLHLRLSVIPRILRWIKPLALIMRDQSSGLKNRSVYRRRKD